LSKVGEELIKVEGIEGVILLEKLCDLGFDQSVSIFLEQGIDECVHFNIQIILGKVSVPEI
jgi:hypothetical protein